MGAEVDEPAVELSLLVGPDLLERGELLIHLRPSCGRIGAVICAFPRGSSPSRRPGPRGRWRLGPGWLPPWRYRSRRAAGAGLSPVVRTRSRVTAAAEDSGHEWVQSAVIDTGQLARTGIGSSYATGMCECSVTTRELNPRSSTAAPSRRGPTPSSVMKLRHQTSHLTQHPDTDQRAGVDDEARYLAHDSRRRRVSHPAREHRGCCRRSTS